MAKKKITAPFYTKRKLGLQSLFHDTCLPNGWLYANGRNKTHIREEDLPDSYMPLMLFKVDGFIRLDGIVDVVYKPNYHINHLHKDDFLYISYSTPIKSEKDANGHTQYYDYDVLLWGGSILHFALAVRKRGTYDMSTIIHAIKEKERYFIRNYPEERRLVHPPFILLSQEEYDDILRQER